MDQEKKKYRRRRRIFYTYAIMFIAQCIITTLAIRSSPPGELNSGILFTISFWITIGWLFALIYLKEFIVGVHWKKVSFFLKPVWWLSFLMSLTYCAEGIVKNYLNF